MPLSDLKSEAEYSRNVKEKLRLVRSLDGIKLIYFQEFSTLKTNSPNFIRHLLKDLCFWQYPLSTYAKNYQ